MPQLLEPHRGPVDEVKGGLTLLGTRVEASEARNCIDVIFPEKKNLYIKYTNC